MVIRHRLLHSARDFVVDTGGIRKVFQFEARPEPRRII